MFSRETFLEHEPCTRGREDFEELFGIKDLYSLKEAFESELRPNYCFWLLRCVPEAHGISQRLVVFAAKLLQLLNTDPRVAAAIKAEALRLIEEYEEKK